MTTDAAAPARDLMRAAILAVLVIDGALCAVLSVAFLPVYLGSVPFPISALVAGIANVLLFLGARTARGKTAVLALPLVAWIVTFFVCGVRGPGGDVLLLSDWRTALLFLLGALPAAILLIRNTMEVTVRRARDSDGG